MGLMDKIWDEVFPSPQSGLKASASADHGAKMPPEISLPVAAPLSPDGASSSTPPQSPTENVDRRASNDYLESRSVRGGASQKITITGARPPRPSLDSSRSLPTGFRYMPEILSPGRRDENVWRSVFHPGSNKATDALGASKFDRADPKGPSVYDWYNPLNT